MIMIDKSSLYFKQTALLLEILPLIDKYECFALKGGTAINMFVQDMPRLSIDIDLTYLPIEGREPSLNRIEQSLLQISQDIQRNIISVSVQELLIKNPSMVSKLKVIREGCEIKIEPNLVIRGSVFSCEDRELSNNAQKAFGMATKMRVVSLADLYGGKICAALDRQHPRDLFDIKFLLDDEGITEEIRKGFLVYLISHDRPMYELFDPIMKDFKSVYEAEFQGMAITDISYEELVQVRVALVDHIKKSLTQSEKEFLLSFKQGDPQWDLLGIEGVQNLPAVQWKLMNVRKMDEKKRSNFMQKLRDVLSQP